MVEEGPISVRKDLIRLPQWRPAADTVPQGNTSLYKVTSFTPLEVFNQRLGDPQMILPLREATEGWGKERHINSIPGDAHFNQGQDGTLHRVRGGATGISWSPLSAPTGLPSKRGPGLGSFSRADR